MEGMPQRGHHRYHPMMDDKQAEILTRKGYGVWFMRFPRPLLAGAMKQYMRKAVKDVCGEGVAAATEYYAGNKKKHCSMIMPAKLDVGKFM